ncbi:MAG TPA: M48 family metalloprotease [Roseomonas sp.]|nr:M48 family metalloprotease [Roseomonas sp.]
MRSLPAPFRTLLLMLAFFTPLLLARAVQAQGGDQGGRGVALIRDAGTESTIRDFAHPLFRAAGADPALARISLIQDRAIDAFVTTGNRLFIHTRLIRQADSAAELVGALAHEAGPIAGGHLARPPGQASLGETQGRLGNPPMHDLALAKGTMVKENHPTPAPWPCPTAGAGSAQCRAPGGPDPGAVRGRTGPEKEMMTA